MKKRIISMLLTAAMVLTLLPTAFAADEGTVSVQLGTVALENGEIYVPDSEAVAKKTSAAPEDGNYIAYDNGTITVHGDVVFSSTGQSVLKITSGTVQITGEEGSKLTLHASGGSALNIEAAVLDGADGVELAGDVDFTAEYEESTPAVQISSGDRFATADGYTGAILLSSKSMAVGGGYGTVSLRTTGSITMEETTEANPLIAAESVVLEGRQVQLTAEAAAPMIAADSDVSITSAEGDLIFRSRPTTDGNAPTISTSGGNVVFNAPNGNVLFDSSGNGCAVSAGQTTVKNAKSFKVTGTFNDAGIRGDFKAENCPVIEITGENGAVAGGVDIDSGFSGKAGSAKFTGKAGMPCITSGAVIKNYENVEISSPYSAVSRDTTIENCGTVKITSQSGTPTLTGAVTIASCDDVTIENTSGNMAMIPNRLQYDNQGKLTITENGVTTVKNNGEVVATVRDITHTGLMLNIGTLPTEKTVYQAGNGTVTFLPATETANAKLVLNNAEISTDGATALSIDFDPRSTENDKRSLDIEVIGENKLRATGTGTVPADGIAFFGKDVTIFGSGRLDVSVTGYYSDGLYLECDNVEIKDVTLDIYAESSRGINALRADLRVNGNADVTVIVGIIADSFTADNSANINALVGSVTTNGERLIAYGKCTIGENMDLQIGEKEILTVLKDAVLTIPEHRIADIQDFAYLTLEGKIINNGIWIVSADDTEGKLNGKIENNGTIVLNDAEDIKQTIKDMHLTGTGLVITQVNGTVIMYDHNGTKLNAVADIDLSNMTGTLPEGCAWDADTNTLTLKNTIVQEITGRANADITIKAEGSVRVTNLSASGALTLTGDAVTVGSLDVQGDLVIEAKNANIDRISNGNGTSRLTFRNTTAAVKFISWTDNGSPTDTHYGVELLNSSVTVGDGFGTQFFAGRIAMDDTSVLTLNNAPIKNYGKYADGMDDLKPYLPAGYTVGKYISGMADEPYTILDASGNIVDTITLKKQEPAKPGTGGSGSSGGSGGGSTAVYAITVKDSAHGTVTADRKTASSGAAVTLTVKPAQGWTLETLTVLDANGKNIDLTTVKAGEQYTFKMPNSKVTAEAVFMEDNAILNFFVDVPSDSYYYDAVRWAAEQNVTSGTDSVHFSPDTLCTRAQIVTFLWRAAGSPAPKDNSNPFADVASGSYYEKAVLWAVENGITKGTSDTTFSPNDTCTRAQSVTFLYRAAGSPAVSGRADFADVPADAYYADAVAWAAQNSITGGIGDGLFGPNKGCTRAQIVTFLYRMYQVK